MRLRKVHLEYWESHRRPEWAAAVEQPVRCPSVHVCVNEHDPDFQMPRNYEAHNLMNLLKMRRNRHGWPGVQAMMEAIVYEPHSTDKDRRIAFCRKWLKKLGKESPEFVRIS